MQIMINSATRLTVHGVFMKMYGQGVLIKGQSGYGKSELALGLIHRGHALIADDAPEFYCKENGEIIGVCPDLLKNFLHVRELGVLNIRALFGDNAIIESCPLSMMVNLLPSASNVSSLTEVYDHECLLGASIQQFTLTPSSNRHLEILLETIVLNNNLKRQGYDGAKHFMQKQKIQTEQGHA